MTGTGMNTITMVALLGTVCGLSWALQAPLSTLMSHQIGPIGSAFVVHLGGALAALMLLPLLGWSPPGAWREIPWYCYGAGVLGVIAIAALVWMVPRVGVATTITVVVSAQLIGSAVLDHFGVLGLEQRTMGAPKMLGLALVLVGLWQTVRST